MAVQNRLHRSELAVPGINPRMLEKAPAAGADVVFLDLEDSVAPDDKEQARKNVISALNTYDWSRCSVSVRVNGLDTHYCYRDIVEVVEQAKDLLRAFGVPVPEGRLVHGDLHAASAAEGIGSERWVVKTQVRAGGRGKGGGVEELSLRLLRRPAEIGTTEASAHGGG